MTNFISQKAFLLIILGIISIGKTVTAQIEVTPATGAIFNPESLITNVFLDEGVDVTNITYSGLDNSIGYFTNGESDMGIDRGIVMSSGFAVTAMMENNAGGTGDVSSGSTVNEPSLSAIASGQIFDVSRYEITFVPTADTLRFKYVFASEEYPEWACSQFNDVFGFFISGPNPDGGNYNNRNIALVPQPSDPSGLTFTNDPVTINNVNAGACPLDYSVYYNSNGPSPSFTFDAYLDVFTAQAIVVPCESYTIKLAVSDVGDNFFDTAVFLEAKSFGTGSLNVETATVSLDGTLSEDCSDASISFVLPTLIESDYFLDYTILGTAENGVDYTFIPDDLFIPAGDSIVTIDLQAFQDDLIEGTESIGFDVQRDPCNRDTFWVFIRDNDILPPELGPDITFCQGDSAQLDGTLPVPLPDPPTFTNTTETVISPTNSDVISQIQVFGVIPFTLSEGVIKRICIDSLYHNWVDDLDIYLISPGGQFLELSTDNGVSGNNYLGTCFTPDATVPINFPGPFAPIDAPPFTGDWLPEGVWSDLYDGENPTNGFWQLVIRDDAQGFTGRLKGWSICFEPIRQFFYSWEPAEGLSCADCPDPVASPDVSTTYYLTATDNYGCEVYDSIHIEVFDAILPPPAICDESTGNSVGISWETVENADSYEVNIDGAGWISVNSLSHSVGDLLLGSCINFEVRGVGLCEGQISSIQCCTPDCALSPGNIDFVENVSCFGYADGSISVSGQTMDPPLSFTIDGIGTNGTGLFTGLPAGNYMVSIADTLNCSTSVFAAITQPDSTISNAVVINNTSCFDGADGSAAFEITGGSGPFQFNWNDGQTDSVGINFSQGVYNVIITDTNGCTLTDEVVISEPEVMSLGFEADSVRCFSENSGTITALVSGGTGDYSYTWDNGQTNMDAENLTAGIYFLTVTDENNCSTEGSIEVFEPAALSLSTTQNNIGCFAGTNGSANVIASGGTEPYSYSWDNGDLTAETFDLLSGAYIVTVTDNNGCNITDTVFIIEAEPILLSTSFTDASCFNAGDGSASVAAEGGSGVFEFLWNDPMNQTTAIASGLNAGTYICTVSDANNCSITETVIVGQATEIFIDHTITNLNCYEIPDGEVTISASGGTTPYTYLWSNGMSSEDISGISAGLYTLTITDANSCSAVDTVLVEEPEILEVLLDVDSVACNGGSDGAIHAMVTGGAGVYDYAWNDGQDSESAINLSAGMYTLIIRDENNCELTVMAEVREPAIIESTTSFTNTSCFDGTDGTAGILATGGVAPFSYSWSNAGETEADISNLPAGNYNITVTDANNCTHFNAVTIEQPETVSLTTTQTNVSCFEGTDGTATVEALGGVGNYSYLWNDNVVQTTATATGLPAGAYTVIVTDGAGCSTSESLLVEEASEIEILVTEVPASCFEGDNGEADIFVSGGTGPYTFAWSNGASTEDLSNLDADIYVVTVTDANNCSSVNSAEIVQPFALNLSFESVNVDCYGGETGAIDITPEGGTGPFSFNWSNGATSEDIAVLPAGVYIVTLTDNNNCEQTLEVSIQQPEDPVSLTIPVPEIICNGASDGTTAVEVSGGTPPYGFLWSNGETLATAMALDAREHIVTVTDSEGCEYIGSVVQNQQAAINVELDIRDPFCHNGEGSATVSAVYYGNTPADTGTFSYAWSNGNTTVNNNNITGGQNYTLTLTDDMGCTGTAIADVGNPGEMFVAVNEEKDISCNGGGDGTIMVDGLGGTVPYSFNWSGNIPGQQDEATIVALSAGTYLVTITDINNCTATELVQLAEPPLLELETRASAVECHGDATGSIEAFANGGVAPYQFSWSNGDQLALADSLKAGTYQLVLTDDNACSRSIEIVIEEPDPISSEHEIRHVDCYEGRNGSIKLTTSGGVFPYTYSMDNDDFIGSDYFIGLGEGSYQIQVRDAKGCVQDYPEVYVGQPEPVLVDFGPDITIDLGESVRLNPEISNTQGLVNYSWTPEDSLNCLYDSLLNCPNPEVNIQYAATYKLTAIDEKGCTGEDIVNIVVLKNHQIFVPTAFSPNQDRINDLLLVHGKEGIEILSFKIYDRWGELVFERKAFEVNNPDIGWDGNFRNKQMSSGLFIWTAEAKFSDGEEVFFKGQTTLIR